MWPASCTPVPVTYILLNVAGILHTRAGHLQPPKYTLSALSSQIVSLFHLRLSQIVSLFITFCQPKWTPSLYRLTPRPLGVESGFYILTEGASRFGP